MIMSTTHLHVFHEYMAPRQLLSFSRPIRSAILIADRSRINRALIRPKTKATANHMNCPRTIRICTPRHRSNVPTEDHRIAATNICDRRDTSGFRHANHAIKGSAFMPVIHP